MQNSCPVCKSRLTEFIKRPEHLDANQYSCPRCGEFRLSRTLATTLHSKLSSVRDAAAKISYALRTMQTNNEMPMLATNTVDEILKRPLPNPSEQADLLIRWIAENVDGPGETVEVNPLEHGAIFGTKTTDGFLFVLRHLANAKLVPGGECTYLS